MAEGYGGMRTEHAGGKNGQGAWMKRAEAKRASKILRREREKKEVRNYEDAYGKPLGYPDGSEGYTNEWGGDL